MRSTCVGVEIAVAAIAVGGQGYTLRGALDAQHGGVGFARLEHRVGAYCVVVGAEHAGFAGDVGARKQIEQRAIVSCFAFLAGKNSVPVRVLQPFEDRIRRACDIADGHLVGKQRCR